MPSLSYSDQFTELKSRISGDLSWDKSSRLLYSTDASEYQEMPRAIARPSCDTDVKAIIDFANTNQIGVIARGAGTSLAGQVVGGGIIVETSHGLNRILSLDTSKRTVRVQPGVVRDELNRYLKPFGLFFAPETSTANRATIGGMVGNNSCGANSIVYGSTRDHLVSARGYLSDGTEVTFSAQDNNSFKSDSVDSSLKSTIYKTIYTLLSDSQNQALITEHFPKPSVKRRNTGYALDSLLDSHLFNTASDKPFNLCKLIAGSEGTLFFGVEYELNCEPLPAEPALLCAHFSSVNEALKSVNTALKYKPSAVELIDKHVLDCTKENLNQIKNRFFIQGDPGAILVIELRDNDRKNIQDRAASLIEVFKQNNTGYAYPLLFGEDVSRVWDLRRAGQGLLSNVEGDAKPREIVEDTAVAVEDLPAYIEEFDSLMKGKYGIACVYYAHAGAGELHTRPLFNLKTKEGLHMFRAIATDVAALVKKYRGSLSGEHGDGRLRGEFISYMVGPECYAMMRRIKETFDPKGILNPGKIIDTPPMDTSLRHSHIDATHEYKTSFDFSKSGGILRATEKCNGSGDCLKSHLTAGTMCPSYMATRNEKDSTRGRANLLRHALSHPSKSDEPWTEPGLAEAMQLCLSCKACKSECPSSVDMTRLKAEWLNQTHQVRGIPLRSQLISRFSQIQRLGMIAPYVYNWAISNKLTASVIKRSTGFASKRSLPKLNTFTFKTWYKTHVNKPGSNYDKKVYLFCDEFTNYNDVHIGIKCVSLLNQLGYYVEIPQHTESARASLSKGILTHAKKCAEENILAFRSRVNKETPLIGIEPSAILSFRDEYLDLVDPSLKADAINLSKNTFLFEEFIALEIDQGRINSEAFIEEKKSILVHGHCHQKALSNMQSVIKMLSLPKGYQVSEIPSGCCGMAGSFGYEKENYQISNQISELVLLPAIRKVSEATIIAASGTSCRHQIKDGVDRTALHPIEILFNALKPV